MKPLLESWIQLATRAPSGDNSQPWDFTFGPDQFTVIINTERARHFLDQDMSATWIGLGCLCENLERSAAFFGLSCQITIASKMSVTVKYQALDSKINTNISEIISQRQTFRGKLGKVDLNLNSLNIEFPVQLGREHSYAWTVVSTLTTKLIWNWSWLESVLWLKTSLMSDFTKWLHTKDEQYEYGVSLESLQVSRLDILSLMLFKKIPSLIKTVPTWFFQIKTFFRLKFLFDNSSGLLCLYGKLNDYRDYFYAGKEIQRMWLYLTKCKIKAQPLAIQSLFLNFIDSDSIKNSLTQAQIGKIKSIKMETLAALKAPQDLLFILRFGTTKESLPLLPRKKILVSK